MRPLEGLHLMVSSDNTCFKEVWMNVLDTAGCHFIHKFPIRSTQSGEFPLVLSCACVFGVFRHMT